MWNPTTILIAIGFILVTAIFRSLPSSLKPIKKPRKANTMIVLGSGGHTAEMFNFMETIDIQNLPRRIYIVAESDVGVNGSEAKANDFENKKKRGGNWSVVRIPRSREVGQSYFSSIFTTLVSLAHSVLVVWREKPDLILTNGPGTCVPICAAAYPLRAFGIKDTRIVFIESIACVEHISVSGKILYHLVDLFCVQWPNLVPKFPKSVYVGRFKSPNSTSTSTFKLKSTGKLGYVFVTVGSTRFDDLIERVDSQNFVDFLKELGYTGLKIQRGRREEGLKNITSQPDFQVESYQFKDSLASEISEAGLVVSHAGAGSIVESLKSQRKLVVVPNEALMNNHQLEIANEMEKLGFSFSAKLSDLDGKLSLTSVIQKAHNFVPKNFPAEESSEFRDRLAVLMNFPLL